MKLYYKINNSNKQFLVDDFLKESSIEIIVNKNQSITFINEQENTTIIAYDEPFYYIRINDSKEYILLNHTITKKLIFTTTYKENINNDYLIYIPVCFYDNQGNTFEIGIEKEE